MTPQPRRDPPEIPAILAAYRSATDDLLDAVHRSDNSAVEDAVERRWGCIRRFSSEVDRFLSLPDAGKDPSFFNSIRWHYLCMTKVDLDVIGRIESLKDEVGEAIVRSSGYDRRRRGYAPHASERESIVEGEG